MNPFGPRGAETTEGVRHRTDTRSQRVQRTFTLGCTGESHEVAGSHLLIAVDAETKKILGAALLGIEGDEVILSILDVMHPGAPSTVIQRAMHAHPTMSELILTLLGELQPRSAAIL